MSHTDVEPTGGRATAIFLCHRALGVGMLLFCFMLYWATAMRGFFFAIPSFVYFSSTVPVVLGATLWLVLRLSLSFERLWSLFLGLLFASLALWVSGLHGHWVVVASAWLLSMAMGSVIAAGLRFLSHSQRELRCKWLLLQVTGLIVGWVLITWLFLSLRTHLGWLLSIRLLLLIPSGLLVISLRQQGAVMSPGRVAIRLSTALPLFPQAALLAGLVLVLLSLLTGYLGQMSGDTGSYWVVVLLFVLAIFTLLPTPKRHAHYLLPVSALSLLLASLVYDAQSQATDPSVWALMALLCGLGLGGCIQAFQAKLHDQAPAQARQFMLSIITLALLVLVSYPLAVHFISIISNGLLTPLLLFFSLLTTFFVTKQ